MAEGNQEDTGTPYVSLREALAVGEAAYVLGGANSAVEKSAIASHLKVSEKSSGFSALLSGAKQFGIIEGRGAFKLSEQGRAYFLHQQKREALLKFLQCPTLYRDLIARFDGQQLPGQEIIANIIEKGGVKAKGWPSRIAGKFMASVSMAEAMDGGFLRYRAAIAKVRAGVADQSPKPSSNSMTDTVRGMEARRDEPVLGERGDAWVTTDQATGASVRLEIRGVLTAKLWSKLASHVQNTLKLDIQEAPQ